MKLSQICLELVLTMLIVFNMGLIASANWYAGNVHTHSTHSDGKHTVDELVEEARRLGFSFLIITDHNGINQRNDCERINAAHDDFLCLWGAEVGRTGGYGHAVTLFITTRVSQNIPAPDMMKIVAAQGGQVWVAHPYVRQDICWKAGFNWDYITGIEVWNSGFSVTPVDRIARAAFRQWDIVNNIGEKKVFGIASSDAHSASELAGAFNRVYMEEFSEAALEKALEQGNFYGTNGPELDFRIDGSLMGSTVKGENRVTLEITAKAENSGKIKIVLFERGNIVDSWESNNSQIQISLSKSVTDPTWFRVELEDDIGGYAFSNPIWVEP